MPNWLRALIAGYGAKKLGGGCFSTILVFVVIWYALGTCNKQPQTRTTVYREQQSPAAAAVKPAAPVRPMVHRLVKAS